MLQEHRWNEEPPEHDQGDGHDDNEEEALGTQESSMLASIVGDSHVKELLRKKTTTERGACREMTKLAQLEEDSKTPLYPGCDPEHTRLNVMLNFLDIKARFKCNDASLNANLQYLHELLPKGNTCPSGIDEAKKIVCPLDLPHVKYHVCPLDCVIYRGEYEDLEECPVCETSQYRLGKKSPQKVVWYFPLIPRLQRYFADKKEAKSSCVGTRIERTQIHKMAC